MPPLSAIGKLSDRARFLVGASVGYAQILSLLVVRGASDSETTLYCCSVLIGMYAILLPLLLIDALSFSPSDRGAMRLKAFENTLSRSLWLEWVGVMPFTLTITLMPSLLRDEWDSENILIGILIGAGSALFMAGWNREAAKDYLAKHQPHT